MSELLNSIKADLLDRRLLPLVALVGVGLIAAIAYAVLGGGSSPATPPPIASASNATQPGGLQVSATTADQSVAETTDGASEQHTGKSRNPFTPLPGASKASTASSTSPSTSGSTSAGTKSPSSSGGTETPAPGKTEESKKPGKTKKPGYHVAVLFGIYPPGVTPETVTLTPYENLKLQQPLPSAQHPLIVFRGVTAGGKSATFTLLGEAILHGLGACLPNPVQCQAIDVKPGQTEQLEYLNPNGETTVYELRVMSITEANAKASKASNGKAKAAQLGWAESKAGRQILRHNGLFSLPFLRYSSQPGVLVFAPRKAKAAKAHLAAGPLFDWR